MRRRGGSLCQHELLFHCWIFYFLLGVHRCQSLERFALVAAISVRGEMMPGASTGRSLLQVEHWRQLPTSFGHVSLEKKTRSAEIVCQRIWSCVRTRAFQRSHAVYPHHLAWNSE